MAVGFSICVASGVRHRVTASRFRSAAEYGKMAESPAWWQSGHAADCKSAYAGSIPTQASSCQFAGSEFSGEFSIWSRHAVATWTVVEFFLCRLHDCCRTITDVLPGAGPSTVGTGTAGSKRHALWPVPSLRRVRHCTWQPTLESSELVQTLHSPDGEIGRRKGLKIPRGQPHAGSIPAPGTS